MHKGIKATLWWEMIDTILTTSHAGRLSLNLWGSNFSINWTITIATSWAWKFSCTLHWRRTTGLGEMTSAKMNGTLMILSTNSPLLHHKPMTLKKSLKESGLEIGRGSLSSGMLCWGWTLGTPLGTREKRLPPRLDKLVSLARTMESVIHCSRGLSRASWYCRRNGESGKSRLQHVYRGQDSKGVMVRWSNYYHSQIVARTQALSK